MAQTDVLPTNVVPFPKKPLAADEHPVDELYRVLARRPGFVSRAGQIHLSKLTREAALADGALVTEAPTGTGKTVAYLAGALLASRERHLPVVIATATVALQDQILNHDLPRLAQAGAVDRRNVAVMKGQGRYWCAAKGATFKDATVSGAEAQTDLFLGGGRALANQTDAAAVRMWNAWEEGAWNGDSDSWSGPLPANWEALQVNMDTCTRKHCPHFEQCQFFKDRLRARNAEVVITNHDMLLLDLKMRYESAPQPLFPFDRYILVVDEAHHLPHKAIAAEAVDLVFSDMQAWAAKVDNLLANAGPFLDSVINEAGFGRESLPLSRVVSLAERFERGLSALDLRPGGHRILKPELPPSWGPVINDLLEALAAVSYRLEAALDVGRKALKQEEAVANDASAPGQIAALGALSRKGREFRSGMLLFMDADDDVVRWIARFKQGYGLSASPLEGSGALSRWLWSAKFPVIMTSATLKTLGDFRRFQRQASLPAWAVYESLAPIFAYHECPLIVADMPEPDQPGYEEALVQEMAARINPDEGSLVLFTSLAMMRRVVSALPERLRRIALVQYDRPAADLVAAHKFRIDGGEGSLLIGVDTLAEGLDLPGDYLTHLLIARLPFAMPDDPVETKRAERLGPRYFYESMLPDASLKLNQAIGRLLRRERDRGRITVLDRRLVTRRYGQMLLKGLPPYRLVVEGQEGGMTTGAATGQRIPERSLASDEEAFEAWIAERSAQINYSV